jgi:ADP-ribose pyrophosphatase YjhB (NUDIX family)
MNTIIDITQHCPQCGDDSRLKKVSNNLRCEACGLTFFINPVSAAGALIFNETGNLLTIIRAKNPGKGKIGLPGGFVDFDETAEEAIAREIREETGLVAIDITYLSNHPNLYTFKDITTYVLDFFFVVKVQDFDIKLDHSEVTSYSFTNPATLTIDDFAFKSNFQALQTYLHIQK